MNKMGCGNGSCGCSGGSCGIGGGCGETPSYRVGYDDMGYETPEDHPAMKDYRRRMNACVQDPNCTPGMPPQVPGMKYGRPAYSMNQGNMMGKPNASLGAVRRDRRYNLAGEQGFVGQDGREDFKSNGFMRRVYHLHGQPMYREGYHSENTSAPVGRVIAGGHLPQGTVYPKCYPTKYHAQPFDRPLSMQKSLSSNQMMGAPTRNFKRYYDRVQAQFTPSAVASQYPLSTKRWW